jgi:hypothetical protein
MSDVVNRLIDSIPKHDGFFVAWRVEVPSELLLEAAIEIAKARAEIEHLQLALGAEVLASNNSEKVPYNHKREWHTVGAWLYPGDTINVVRAPLPPIQAEVANG